MDAELVAMQLFSGVALGAILIMVALGLSIIVGMLGVVNFALGAFFMVGAYAGLWVASLTGSFWWGLLIAPIAIGLFGMAIERFLIRPLYKRSVDDPLLLTFGLGYVLVEAVRIVFGSDGIPFQTPSQLAGVAALGIGFFPSYRLIVGGGGVGVLAEAFVVTVIGGMGSLVGAVVAGLLVGVAISMTALFAPEMATIVMFALMALVLLVRPQGLFGKPGRA